MATVLVTGASAGLGEEFAWQVSAAGHDVVLVARNRDRLSELADTIRHANDVEAEVLAADLSDRDQIEQVAQRVADPDRPISLVINNAGFGTGLPFASNTWESERAMLDVMVTATMRLSHAALPGMIERGHGAVLNVSSIAAHLANSTYAAHKRWLIDFTQAMAAQLKGTGVSASVLVPGLVHTNFHDGDQLAHMKSGFPEFAWLEPEPVVAAALAGVRRGSTVITPSVRYAAAAGIMKLLPTALTRNRATLHRR